MTTSRASRASLVAAVLAWAGLPAQADGVHHGVRMLLQPDDAGGAPVTPPPTITDVAGAPRPITLPEVLSLAVRQAPELERATIDIEIAMARIEEARAYQDWDVAANLRGATGKSIGRFGGLTAEQTTIDVLGQVDVTKILPTGGSARLHAETGYNWTKGDVRTSETWIHEVSATWVEPLLRGRGGWLLRAGETRAEIARDAAELGRRATAIAVVRDVVNAYWDLVLAQRDLAIRVSSLELAQERLRRTQAAIKGGGIAATEALAVEQVIATREEEILGAELAVIDRSIEVRRLIGLTIGPGELMLSTDTELGLPSADWDLDALIAAAYRTSPELAQLSKQGQAAALEVEVTENGLLPRLDVAVTFGPTGTSNRPTEALENMVTFDGVTAVGVLTYQQSIGNRAASGRARAARAERLRVRIDETDARAQIAQALAHAVVLAESAARRVEIAGRAIVLAEKNITAEQSRFGLGKATNFDVLERQEELKQAQLRQARALIDWHKAATVIASISGDLLDSYAIDLTP
jgi:outer membrane protein